MYQVFTDSTLKIMIIHAFGSESAVLLDPDISTWSWVSSWAASTKPVPTNSFRVLKSALWAILAESSILVEAFDNHFGNYV